MRKNGFLRSSGSSLLKVFKKIKDRTLFSRAETNGSIEITTVVGCNVGCRYCPQDELLRKYFLYGKPEKILSFDVFRACIDKIPSKVHTHFSGMAEPWLNDQTTNMIAYASQKGHMIAIYTTLVGMSLEDVDRIKDLPGIYDIVIHLPDIQGYCDIPITSDYLCLLKSLRSLMGDKIRYHCHGEVHPAVMDSMDMKPWMPMHDRAGNVKNGFSPCFKEGRIHCIRVKGRLMNRNVLLPNGDVLLCCMDYGMDHFLGNLLEIDYNDLFRSAEALRIQKALADPRFGSVICRKCINSTR